METSHRIRSFDGLRGIAVSLVLLMHISYGHFPGGFIGVDIFFVLSGYLITGVLMRPGTSLGGFYLRRVRRLAPALVIAIALCLVSWRTDCPAVPFWPAAFAAIAYFADFAAMRDAAALGTLGPCWSLAVEEQFYIVWPLALLALRPVRAPWVLASSVAIVAAITRGALHTSYFSPITHIDSVLAGCVVALIPTLPRMRSLAWGVVVALPVLGMTVDFEGQYYVWGSPIVTIGMMFAISEARLPGRLSSFLSLPPLVWLGKRSYGIYLYQTPINMMFEPLRRHHDLFNLLVITTARIATTLFLSEISFRFVESPILNAPSRSLREVPVPERG